MKRLLMIALFAVVAAGLGGCRIYPGGYGWYDYSYDNGWYSPAPVVRGPVVYRNPYFYQAGHHRGW